ncbi:MAG TPA: hypothetical protein PK449_00205, partial [Exilispira sp.]|nr:hypothetical protein [Exilispira sp.]
NINNFQIEQSNQFDTYITNILQVLNTGKSSVGAIDAYVSSYLSMIQDYLGVLIPDNAEISDIFVPLISFTKYLNNNKDRMGQLETDETINFITSTYNNYAAKLKSDFIVNFSNFQMSSSTYSGCINNLKASSSSFIQNKINNYTSAINTSVHTYYSSNQGSILLSEDQIKNYIINKLKADCNALVNSYITWEETIEYNEKFKKTYYAGYTESSIKNATGNYANLGFETANDELTKLFAYDKIGVTSSKDISSTELKVVSTSYNNSNGNFIINYALNCTLSDGSKKSLLYSMTYNQKPNSTQDQPDWGSTVNRSFTTLNGTSSGTKISGVKSNISSFFTGNDSYFNKINNLLIQKSNIVQSISNIQSQVLNMCNNAISEGKLLEMYGIQEENKESVFDSVLSIIEDNVYLSDYDIAVCEAYYRKKFWGQQMEIVENVLQYALNEGGRENAEQTKQEYEDARQAYQDALDSYQAAVEGLNGLSLSYNELSEQLSELKKQLADKQKEYQHMVELIASSEISDAQISSYIQTFLVQINNIVDEQNDFLCKITSTSDVERSEITSLLDAIDKSMNAISKDMLSREIFSMNNGQSLAFLFSSQKQIKDSISLIQFTDENVNDESETIPLATLKESYANLSELEKTATGLGNEEFSTYLKTLLENMKNIIDLHSKDQDINKKSIMEKLFNPYHTLLLYFESSINAQKAACATYTEVVNLVSSMSFQNAEHIQEVIKNELESLQKDQTSALVNDILDYASKISEKLETGNNYATYTLNTLINANISILKLDDDGIDKAFSLIEAYNKYARQQENTEEDKAEKENLKSIYLSSLNELISEIVNPEGNSDLTDQQKSLLNFINSFLLPSGADIDKGYELILSFICSCIYNDLENMVTTTLDENNQEKKIADISQRINYLNSAGVQSLIKAMGCEVAEDEDGKKAEKYFSYLHNKVKDIYFAFIEKSIKDEKQIYTASCIDALNNKNLDQMIDDMNSVSKNRYSLIFMQIFLNSGIFAKQWENITLSNSLICLDDYAKNALSFSNEIYLKQKDSYNKVTANENLKIGESSDGFLTISDYMKALRQKSYNDFYTFVDIYNEFKSFDKEMTLFFGDNSNTKARQIALSQKMLGNYSFISSTYSEAQLNQAKDIINKLKSINGFSQWKNGINNNPNNIIDLKSTNGLSLNELSNLDTASLTMVIAYMFGNASECSSNPLLSGYYQQIATMAIQNAVTYVYLKEKSYIVDENGCVSIQKLYEKLNNYLKTTYIDGITEDQLKTSFSLTNDEAKSLKQKCSDTVNKIIDGIFANSESAEITAAIKQITEIIGCINDYTIADKISLQMWYNEKIKIKSDKEKSLLENTLNNFINEMKQNSNANADLVNISFAEIENAINFEKAVQSYSATPVIGKLITILDSSYFKNLAINQPEKAKIALVQFLSMYGSYNVEISSKITRIYSNNFENRTELKKIIDDIKSEYEKIFENAEVNNMLPALFGEEEENINSAKSFCVNYCMQDIIMITEDGQKLKTQMEDYIKEKIESYEKNAGSIYSSKGSFDGWIEILGDFVYNPDNPEDNLISSDIVQRYIDETIMRYRIIFGSKLVAGSYSESETVEILNGICVIEKDFAGFLYNQGVLTQSNAAYVNQFYRSFIIDDKGSYALQNLVNTMSYVAANLSIYREKASIKSIIEKSVNDCNTGSDAKQAFTTYLSYMNGENVSYNNAVQQFRDEKITYDELKAMLSYINISEDDIINSTKLWLEGNKKYEISDSTNNIIIKSATIFCSTSHAVNSFIDTQNKLIQLLIALEDISGYTIIANENQENLSGDSNYDKLLSIYNQISTVNSLDELNSLGNALDNISIEQTAGGSILSSYSDISFHQFSSGQLVSMIEKMIKAKNELKNSNTNTLKNDEKILNDQITEIESKIKSKEVEVKTSKDNYNLQVDNVNNLVSAADEAYLNYLKAKEVYFFCVNIYADGKDMSKAIDMYRCQLAEYTQKYNEQAAIYDIALQVFQDKNAQKWDITKIIDDISNKITDQQTAIQLLSMIAEKMAVDKEQYEKSKLAILSSVKNKIVSSLLIEKNIPVSGEQETKIKDLMTFMENYFKLSDNNSQTFNAMLQKVINDLFVEKYCYIEVTVTYKRSGNSGTGGSGNDSEYEPNIPLHDPDIPSHGDRSSISCEKYIMD